MAVPARPTSGVPIETAWGQVAHDTAVAQDVQTGQGTIPAAPGGTGSLVVTFPRPFASAPVVMVSGQNSNAAAAQPLSVGTVTATQCTIIYRHRSDAAGLACPIAWLAYGPRA